MKLIDSCAGEFLAFSWKEVATRGRFDGTDRQSEPVMADGAPRRDGLMSVAFETRRALLSELDQLVSEGCNPDTMGIDMMSTRDVLATINREDASVAPVVERHHRATDRSRPRSGRSCAAIGGRRSAPRHRGRGVAIISRILP